MHVQVYSRNELTAEMDVDTVSKSVSNYIAFSSDVMHLPFGFLTEPTYEMFLSFMEERCPPRQRADIKRLLDNWGLVEYDPVAIVKRTHGLMFSDFIWVRFDMEDITYDEIKIRSD